MGKDIPDDTISIQEFYEKIDELMQDPDEMMRFRDHPIPPGVRRRVTKEGIHLHAVILDGPTRFVFPLVWVDPLPTGRLTLWMMAIGPNRSQNGPNPLTKNPMTVSKNEEQLRIQVSDYR